MVVVVAAMAVAVAVAVVVVAVASSDGMTVRSSSTAGVEDGDAANANRAVLFPRIIFCLLIELRI